MWKRLVPTAIAILVLAPVVRADHDRGARRGDPFLWGQRLEFATREVRHTAEYRLRPFIPREREALRRIERLDRVVRRLNRELERFGPGSYRLDDDLDRLFRAFDSAAFHVDHLRSRSIRRDFARVARVMDRIPRALRVARFDRGPELRRPHGSRGSVILGDARGRTRYRVRVDW